MPFPNRPHQHQADPVACVSPQEVRTTLAHKPHFLLVVFAVLREVQRRFTHIRMSKLKLLGLVYAYHHLPIVQAKPLDLPHEPVLQQSQFSSNFSYLYPNAPPNGTVPSLMTPGVYQIQCDGDRYGHNPDIRDCEIAHLNIEPDSKQYTFGERHTGLPADVFPLPWISMGGAYRNNSNDMPKIPS